MGKFLQGLLLGTVVGLLIAPMSGEELRRRIKECFRQIQVKMPNSKFGLRSADVSQDSYTLQSSRQVDNEPIIFPLNPTESSKGAGMPSKGTSLSAQQTPYARLYTYESTLEEMDYEPLILPVETFEEIKTVKPEGEQTPRNASSAVHTTNPNKNLTHQSRHKVNK